MDMKDLYCEMKDAIDYFGLRFHEMDKIEVKVEEGKIHLRFDNRTVTLEVREVS